MACLCSPLTVHARTHRTVAFGRVWNMPHPHGERLSLSLSLSLSLRVCVCVCVCLCLRVLCACVLERLTLMYSAQVTSYLQAWLTGVCVCARARACARAHAETLCVNRTRVCNGSQLDGKVYEC